MHPDQRRVAGGDGVQVAVEAVDQHDAAAVAFDALRGRGARTPRRQLARLDLIERSAVPRRSRAAMSHAERVAALDEGLAPLVEQVDGRRRRRRLAVTYCAASVDLPTPAGPMNSVRRAPRQPAAEQRVELGDAARDRRPGVSARRALGTQLREDDQPAALES